MGLRHSRQFRWQLHEPTATALCVTLLFRWSLTWKVPSCRVIDFQHQAGAVEIPAHVTAIVRCAPRGNRLRLHSAAYGRPIIRHHSTLHFDNCDVEAYEVPVEATRPAADALEMFGNANRSRLSMAGGTLLFSSNVRITFCMQAQDLTVMYKHRSQMRPSQGPYKSGPLAIASGVEVRSDYLIVIQNPFTLPVCAMMWPSALRILVSGLLSGESPPVTVHSSRTCRGRSVPIAWTVCCSLPP